MVRTKKYATSRRLACLTPRFDVLCALSENTVTAKWNLFVLYIDLIWVIPHSRKKIRNVLKNLRSDDLRVKNFEAHYAFFMRLYVNHKLNSPRKKNSSFCDLSFVGSFSATAKSEIVRISSSKTQSSAINSSHFLSSTTIACFFY